LLKYSSVNHTSFRGKEVNSTYRRRLQGIHREDIGSQIDLRLLGKHLQPIIEESLRECGKANYRKGTILTPLFCVFVVLGLAIRRDLSYPHIIDWLVCGLRWLTSCLPAKLVKEGTLSHARKGLGIEVFRRIFQKMVAHQDTLVKDFHGLTSVAFDGTSATMADTPSNRERFGLPNGGRGAGGYPQLRAVALLVLPLRMVADIAYASYKGKGSGERSLMRQIIERLPHQNLLFLLDAGLYAFEWLHACTRNNGWQVLAKLSASVKPKRIPGKTLPDGS
jgi:Insertion element 4 transposase N-terminal